MTTDVWLWWWYDDLRGQPHCYFDSERSGCSRWMVSAADDSEPLPHLYFDTGRTSLAKLQKYKIFPSQAFKLVREEAAKMFSELPPGVVELWPATLYGKNGEVDDYFLVRPKILVSCTDLAASDVDWFEPGKLFNRWKNLQFKEGCLGEHAIAREYYSQIIVVSNEFRSKLLAIAPKDTAFTVPNGSRAGYAPWVK